MAEKAEPKVERWPCKCCGHDPILHKRKIKGTSIVAYMVSCSYQRCQVYPATAWRGSEKEASEDWNKRYGDHAMASANKRRAW